MFSPASSNKKLHQILGEETGTQFYNPLTHQQEQSFSYEIQMEKQYVQRLKMQRQKIEALYSKYDLILNEMKMKDTLIQQKQQKIINLSSKIKDLQIHCQELGLIQDENKQVINENMLLKHRIINLENQNQQVIDKIKYKQSLISDQRDEMDYNNCQLQEKINIMNNKILTLQQQQQNVLKIQKQKSDQIKGEYSIQINGFQKELNLMRQELIRKQELIHTMKMEQDFMEQKLNDQEDSYSIYLKDLQVKIEKSTKQKKLQIKSLKDIIQQKNLQIGSLEIKVSTLKQQLESKQAEVSESKVLLAQQKRIFDEDLFNLKAQMTSEKNYYKEQFMHCQNHISKIEAKLSDSLKREKELAQRLRKIQANEAAKRSLRLIQRQQIEKINKILSLQ